MKREYEKELEGKGYGKVMVSLEEARIILEEKISYTKGSEQINLWEAGGRVLSEEIGAKEPVPPFDRSPLDGYAMRSQDVANASVEGPVCLEVIEEVPAGHVATKELKSGETIKVFTGAPVPQGADAVIRYEDVKAEAGSIWVREPVTAGAGIAPAGEDISAGEVVLKAGQVIGPAELGILSSLGIDPVLVCSKPKVGICCTGDELVGVKLQLAPGKIRVSNLNTLAEIVRKAGGDPVDLGIVKDDKESIHKVGKSAAENNLDLLITTGGVSVGDYDVVKNVMAELEAERLFWKVAVRPGAPVAASVIKDTIWIGLSGNPAGAIVMTLLLAAPLVAKMSGSQWCLRGQRAKLKGKVNRKRGLTGYWWAQAEEIEGELWVEPLIKQHCGAVKSFLKSNCLLKVPQGQVSWKEGSIVEIFKY